MALGHSDEAVQRGPAPVADRAEDSVAGPRAQRRMSRVEPRRGVPGEAHARPPRRRAVQRPASDTTRALRAPAREAAHRAATGASKLRGGSLPARLRAPAVGPPSAGAALKDPANGGGPGGATRNPQSLVRFAQNCSRAPYARNRLWARKQNLRPATSRRVVQGLRRALPELLAVGRGHPAQVQDSPAAADGGDRGGVRVGRL